jgi:integrase
VLEARGAGVRITVGKYKGSVYRDGDRWVGALNLGWTADHRRERLKRKGLSPGEVKRKLRRAVKDLELKERGWSPVERAVAGFLTEMATLNKNDEMAVDQELLERLIWAVEDLRQGTKAAVYTVRQAVTDFLSGLAGQGKAPSTMKTYWGLVNNHLVPQLGKTSLLELSADAVEGWLRDRAKHLTTSTIRVLHGLLKRALRRADRYGKVSKNVAELVDTPHGCKPGRPSKSLLLDEACALLSVAIHGGHRLGPYIVVGLTTGLRTEELRSLRWDDVDLDAAVVYVVRSDRFGGDTKTAKSRRALSLPQLALEALRLVRAQQETDKSAAGDSYHDLGLVFCRLDGRALTAGQVYYWFLRVTAAAGLAGFCPRELRHTFVSVLSDSEVPAEQLKDLVGHSDIHTTLTVYRQQIKPIIRVGAQRMDVVFAGKIPLPVMTTRHHVMTGAPVPAR